MSEPVTGVVANHKPEYLDDEIMNGIDLAWYEHLNYCTGQCQFCSCNHEKTCRCYNVEKHRYVATEYHDHCGPCERGDTLIGKWTKGPEGYEPDKTGDYAAIVRESVTQVVWSKWTKETRRCSPCYPGQGDLDTPGSDYLAYDLPPEVYGAANTEEAHD